MEEERRGGKGRREGRNEMEERGKDELEEENGMKHESIG